jgi:hypothetical protein
MTKFSQDFTVKSNARRAARKAGVDPSKVFSSVKAGKKLFRFALPDTNGLQRRAEARTGKVAKAKAAPNAKAAKPAKSEIDAAGLPRPSVTKPKQSSERGQKFTAVAALLRKPGGASMDEVTKATGWKPHSARARISVDVSKMLAKGEEIVRRREEGQSWYAIVPSKQLDLLD